MIRAPLRVSTSPGRGVIKLRQSITLPPSRNHQVHVFPNLCVMPHGLWFTAQAWTGWLLFVSQNPLPAGTAEEKRGQVFFPLVLLFCDSFSRCFCCVVLSNCLMASLGITRLSRITALSISPEATIALIVDLPSVVSSAASATVSPPSTTGSLIASLSEAMSA